MAQHKVKTFETRGSSATASSLDKQITDFLSPGHRVIHFFRDTQVSKDGIISIAETIVYEEAPKTAKPTGGGGMVIA